MGWDIDRRRAHCLRAVLLAASLSAIAATHIAVPVASAVPQAGGSVIDVPAGGNLQQALNAVQPGGTMRLAPGATYVGSFTLPAKNGTEYILITTGDARCRPPARGSIPSYKPRARDDPIRQHELRPDDRSRRELLPHRRRRVRSQQERLRRHHRARARGPDDARAMPHHIELDRVLIAGDPAVGQKRAIAANAANVTIINSDIRDIKAVGQDSQAIAAWNSPGPVRHPQQLSRSRRREHHVRRRRTSACPESIPSDIVVEDNLLTKDPALAGHVVDGEERVRAEERAPGGRARATSCSTTGAARSRVSRSCSRRGTRAARRRGSWYRTSSSAATSSAHSGSAFNLLGHDDTDAERSARARRHQDNLVFDINGTTWGGHGDRSRRSAASRATSRSITTP